MMSEPRVALISDELTAACFKQECPVKQLTPLNAKWHLRFWKPDLLLVESVWEGHRGSWKYQVAAYPDVPTRTNHKLRQVVDYARSRGIPTVFWNKEDGVHFERFINSAQLFDHVFTVDQNCIPRYRARVSPGTSVDTLLFAVQPKIHFPKPTKSEPLFARACFLGSYSRHIHDQRRVRQQMLFDAAAKELGLTIFDRNWRRKSQNYRYPAGHNVEVRDGVAYSDTGNVYRDYLVSLNVNTIEDSPTMFSRRLVEIMGCGGLAVTTPGKAVDELFGEYCYRVDSYDAAADLFARLKRDGLSRLDTDMMRAAAAHVSQHHTWRHRIAQILTTISS